MWTNADYFLAHPYSSAIVRVWIAGSVIASASMKTRRCVIEGIDATSRLGAGQPDADWLPIVGVRPAARHEWVYGGRRVDANPGLLHRRPGRLDAWLQRSAAVGLAWPAADD